MFAIYIVVVEDTGENDMDLAQHVESLERVAGSVDSKTAEEWVANILDTWSPPDGF